ncbi:MAG: NAD-dependent epimerase/dehydratase family protein [bacterium]
MSQEHVLLLGGTRFIGPHCVTALREAGYEPTVFHRGKTAWPGLGPEPASIIGDRKEAADLATAARAHDWSAVIDLTAYKPAESALAMDAFNERTNIFVHISTGSVYQVLKDYHNPYAEEDALLFSDPAPLVDEDPNDPGMAYGLNKRACEEVLLQAYEENGFPVTIIRPPIVSGPLDYTLRDATYLMRVRDGGPLIVPVNSGAFRHVAVQDLAKLIVASIDCWDASIGEAFNAGGASLFSLPEYLLCLARILNLPEPAIVPIPMETIEREIGMASQPFGYSRSAVPDIAKAQLILDWSPRRAEEYLPEVIQWVEQEYQGEPPKSYSEHREKELAVARDALASV